MSKKFFKIALNLEKEEKDLQKDSVSFTAVSSEESLALQQPPQPAKKRNAFLKDMKKNWRLHIIILPVLVFFIVFSYLPMVGIVTAFMDYRPTRGIFDSTWVGFEHFERLFSDSDFGLVFRNTVVMALLNLIFGFLAPVVFALLISEIRVKWVNKTFQIMSYLPNFVAPVVICNLVTQFLSVDGAVTGIFVAFGMEEQDMLSNPDYFWAINTFVNVWQTMGYTAIVFTAAIMGTNQDLHEAAVLDGANRWQRVIHVTIPGILPMLVTMFILKVGLMFSTGFDNILLLYRVDTYDTADVISTYTYRQSFGESNYGYAAAVGLFQSVIATALLLITNWASKMIAKTSLF